MAATDVTPTTPARELPPPRRRRLRPRVSSGHVLTVAAALLAAVANFAVLRGDDAGVSVLVAREDIPAGTALSPERFEVVTGQFDPSLLTSLLPPDELARLGGRVAAVPIPAGAPVRRADLADAVATEDGGRRIAIPVDPERAVGGRIAPEDRIDVIQVRDGEASYLVSGARVLAVADASTPGLGAIQGFHVTIAVDADTALCLASAIEAGGITVVLSTGQQPVPTSPCATAGASGEVGSP